MDNTTFYFAVFDVWVTAWGR